MKIKFIFTFLILKLQDTEADYLFSFVGFEELATTIDYQIMPENYKESKKKELLDLIEIYENDPVSYINNHVGEGGKTIRIDLEGDEKKD